MAQQVRQPLAVLDVGLAPRPALQGARALTRMMGWSASKRLKTGRQETPVLSSAPCPTCWAFNQSLRATRSAVMGPQVRTVRCPVPSEAVTSTPATTVF